MTSQARQPTDSVTAQDYINAQLSLESEARDALPYSFDTCTRPMGLLRQPIYSCRTCTAKSAPPHFGDPTTSPPSDAAALCYSCSISCHGDHDLVEIFEKREVACDCGTTRIPGQKCTLTKEVDAVPEDGKAGARKFGQNYWGRFCVCEVVYNPDLENGTMYQCLLGDACGEDWFHDGCIVGAGPPKYHANKNTEKGADGDRVIADVTADPEKKESTDEAASDPKHKDPDPIFPVEEPVVANTDSNPEDKEEDDDRPPGFPKDDDFEHFICWKCVEANPWLRRYAGAPGFLPAVPHKPQPDSTTPTTGTEHAPADFETEEQLEVSPQTLKRKSSLLEEPSTSPEAKRTKSPVHGSLSTKTYASSTLTTETQSATATSVSSSSALNLCTAPPLVEDSTPVSLFLTEDFRTHFCRCKACFQLLANYKCLLEEEETYSPPKDEDAASETGSLYDAGEAALQGVDRVRAIEGMAMYNVLKERVKSFLRPYAESGQTVEESDVRAFAEQLKNVQT